MINADHVRFFLKRLGERLWVRPLAVCLLSILGVWVAEMADGLAVHPSIPQVTVESLEALLSIMASSMLVIATFAVASMVSAYASASSSATPRSFSLVIADDVSQNALSTFIGAFIFSVVGLIAVKNNAFEEGGIVFLFGLTIVVFGLVILTFVRWVDRIARLGRLGATVDKVEDAAAAAIRQRRAEPNLGGRPLQRNLPQGQPIRAKSVGYVQRVDVPTIQSCAESMGAWVAVAALPGAFAGPGAVLAYAGIDGGEASEAECEGIADAFVIGRERTFDEDPRFGLIALAEIADRALSPGINDPGTAIAILGSYARLFALWADDSAEEEAGPCHRVEVPEISTRDMFDDAFTPVARDGAGAVEVPVRLLKTLESLSTVGPADMRDAAIAHARLALARAEDALKLPEDRELVQAAAGFARTSPR